MAILVTGGAGFIGSHLMERLVEEGAEVVCLDSFDDFYSPQVKRANIASLLEAKRIRLYEGDICDRAFCEEIFQKERPEVVVHLAARAGVRASFQDPLLYERVNCGGTLLLLELAARNEVGKFIYGSSSSVYGRSPRIPFQEDDPSARPISPYAASKHAGELFVYTYHSRYGLPAAVLRFFTVYGPRQRPDMAIHKFTRLIWQDKPIPVYGDGTSKRDYTYFSDIIDGTMAAIEADLGFEIINLGDSRVVELNHLIGLLEENLGKKARIERLPEQPGDVPITYADISRAERLLGYTPEIPIEEGVKRFVEWFKENRERLT
ncbi:MAG: epimerase [Planctomycetes bacterium DG_23]|nr:MAG: epimerase [Planctomycetes bacterium DG_23]